MIPNPLGLRLDPSRPVRDQIREAARLGAQGVVIDAIGDLAPARLTETGRRDLKHQLRSVELSLTALSLPTRRPFDTPDQMEDRLNRAEAAFALAFELGAGVVVARVGGIPPETETEARTIFLNAIRELGRRADHLGVVFAVETGPDAGEALRALLDGFDCPGLGASVDPAALLQNGHDPGAAARALGPWVVHAYASEPAATRILSLTRHSGSPPGSLHWEEYLGSLEEVGYRGPLTVWPDHEREVAPQFKAMVERFRAF